MIWAEWCPGPPSASYTTGGENYPSTLRKSGSKDPTQDVHISRDYEGHRKHPHSEQIRQLCAPRQDHGSQAGGASLPHTLFLADTQHIGINLEMHQSITLCPKLYFSGQKTECDKLINDPLQWKLQLKHIFLSLSFAFTIVFCKSSLKDTYS